MENGSIVVKDCAPFISFFKTCKVIPDSLSRRSIAMKITTRIYEERASHPRWVIQVILCLVAFAANSILCRQALIKGQIDPESFTMIRLLSGGLFLLLLTRIRKPGLPVRGSWTSGLCLFLYAYLFSIAYVELGAGMGALILFGAVQVTMFICSWAQGECLRIRVVVGMLIASCGLILLFLPGTNSPALDGFMLMTVSGIAWGAYSLLGKGAANPLAQTTGNFVKCLPFLILLVPVMFLKAALI